MIRIGIISDKDSKKMDLNVDIQKPIASEILTTIGLLRKAEDKLLKTMNKEEK